MRLNPRTRSSTHIEGEYEFFEKTPESLLFELVKGILQGKAGSQHFISHFLDELLRKLSSQKGADYRGS